MHSAHKNSACKLLLKSRCSFSGRAFANVLHVFISPFLINGVHCAMTERKKISAIFAAAYNKWPNFLVTLSALRLILKGERANGRSVGLTNWLHTAGASESAHAPPCTHPPGRDPNFGPASLLLSIQMRLVIVLQIENRLRSAQTETSQMGYKSWFPLPACTPNLVGAGVMVWKCPIIYWAKNDTFC